MKKSQRTKNEKKLFWLAVSALIISVITGIYALLSINDMQYRLQLGGQGELQTVTDLSQLKTCYQYSIHPCDLDTINRYLHQHGLDK